MNWIIPGLTCLLSLVAVFFLIKPRRSLTTSFFSTEASRSFGILAFLAIGLSSAMRVIAATQGRTPFLNQQISFFMDVMLFVLLGLVMVSAILTGRKVSFLSWVILIASGFLLSLIVFQSHATGERLPNGAHTVELWFRAFAILTNLAAGYWLGRQALWHGKNSRRGLGGGLFAAGTLAWLISSSKPQISPFMLILSMALWLAGVILLNRPQDESILGPEIIQQRRMKVKTYSIIAAVASVLGLVGTLPFWPWYFGIANVPFKSTYTTSVPDNNNGVYMLTDQGVMQVYSWSIEPDDFPSDAPTFNSFNIHQIVVVSKVFDNPENYQLMNGTTGYMVRWQQISQKGTQLILDPGPLDPGQYELISPTDNMFGGDTYQYFIVQ